MNAFETNGMWWLPDSPDDYVAGILKFDPITGTTLETVGYLGSSQIYFDLRGTKLIYGITQNQNVTLHEAVCTTHSGGSRQSQIWTIEEILIGAHLNLRELRFDHMTIRYASLKNWILLSGLVDDIDYASRQGKITYNSLDLVETEINGFNIKIKTRVASNISSGASVKLEEDAIIQVNINSPLEPNEWAKQFFNPLRRFLSFAMDFATYPKEIIFSSQNTSVEYSNPSKTIDYFYKLREVPSIDDAKSSKIPLFYFTDVQESISTHLKLWFERYGILEDVLGLYYAAVLNPPQYINSKFLLLAQALETYHRVAHDGSYITKKEYQKVVLPLLKKAVRDLPWEKVWQQLEMARNEQNNPTDIMAEHKTALQQRINESLSFSYEYSLATRLEAIFSVVLARYFSVIAQMVPDIDTLITTIKDTRNYYTHYSKSKESKAVTSGLGLLELSIRVKAVLQLCIFYELGFPSDAVEKIAKRPSFQHIYQKPSW